MRAAPVTDRGPAPARGMSGFESRLTSWVALSIPGGIAPGRLPLGPDLGVREAWFALARAA